MSWDWLEQDGLKYIYLPEWDSLEVTAAFTTRVGGISQGAFESLNLGLHVGDDPELVLENRKRTLYGLGISLAEVVCAEQVHGTQVAVVEAKGRGRGAVRYEDSLPGYDAMICNTPEVYLMTFYADCLPIYFFDPKKRAIGLAHSGWKGTVGRIVEATVAAMVQTYNCSESDILAFVGPGIGGECYPIDDNRKSEVERVFTFTDSIVYPIDKGRYNWNLKLTNYTILRNLGIPEDNIAVCELCTSCNDDLFFSYRGSGGKTGRMAAILGLRE
ncbi:MAG: peptidoglycan editing factor PgeF [Candidatus Saccharibacteria bacterium]